MASLWKWTRPSPCRLSSVANRKELIKQSLPENIRPGPAREKVPAESVRLKRSKANGCECSGIGTEPAGVTGRNVGFALNVGQHEHYRQGGRVHSVYPLGVVFGRDD